MHIVLNTAVLYHEILQTKKQWGVAVLQKTDEISFKVDAFDCEIDCEFTFIFKRLRVIGTYTDSVGSNT